MSAGRSHLDNAINLIRLVYLFIEEIRKNQKDHDIGNSVRMAIEHMPDNYVIKGFLIGHIKEGARRLGDVCFARTVMKWRRGNAGYSIQ